MDSATYEYWPQGWLKKVIYNDLSTIEYFYDDAGNRTSVVVTPAPPLAPLAAQPPAAPSDESDPVANI